MTVVAASVLPPPYCCHRRRCCCCLQALAKELSAKGRAAAERMWAAHERAKSHIFTQRNAKVQQQLQQQQRGGPATATPVLDLHGKQLPFGKRR